LTLEVGGLDENREIVIEMNGGEAAVIDADPECIKRMCEKRFAIPASLVRQGRNELRLVRHGKGPYLVANLLLNPLPPLNDAEKITVERWIEGAERAYADRGISLENVVYA